MKPFYILLVGFLVNSCQFFNQSELAEKKMLSQKLSEINWSEVDEFPSIANCEKINSKTQRNNCFFEVLNQLIQEKLVLDTLGLDTITLKITITPNSALTFEPQYVVDSIPTNATEIDSILKKRLIGFPKINPAIKRGIPVKTQFILPINLKEE